MRLEESRIYVNMKRLIRMVYDTQFLMDKGMRIVYGTRIINALEDSFAYYIKSFKVADKGREYASEAVASFAVFRMIWEFVNEKHIIHFAKRKVKNSKGEWVKPDNPNDEVNTMLIDIFSVIGDIDNDMCKWLTSKGKIAHDKVRGSTE